MRTCNLSELNLPDKHNRFIRSYVNGIADEPCVEKIILFGSCVKGNANIESDIDIFIITKNSLADDGVEKYNLLYRSTEGIPLSDYVYCDILTASINDVQQEATPLIRAVLREGVELNGML